jgi:hypothetical protein
MATRITGGTLTVTITEALTMTHATTADNRVHSQTITKTFASIDNLEKRVLNLPNTNQVEIVSLGSTATSGLGVFKRSAIEYIRITNLDATSSNYVTVILEATGADTACIKVDGDGGTLMLTDAQIEAFTDGSAFSAWSDLHHIFLKAYAANTQVEIVIATTD